MSDDLKSLKLAGYASEILRDHLPTILIDSREQTALTFARLPLPRVVARHPFDDSPSIRPMQPPQVGD